MRKRVSRKYDKRVYRMFLRSYMCIMLLPVLFSAAAYVLMARQSLANEQEKIQYALSQIGQDLDSEFETIDTLMTQTLFGRELTVLAVMKPPREDVKTVVGALAFRSSLSKYYVNSVLVSALVDEYLVCLSSPNLLFSAAGEICFDPGYYYDAILRPDGMTRDEWLSMLRGRQAARFVPSQPMTYCDKNGAGKTENVTLYVRPILLGGAFRGNMLAVIPNSAFVKILSAHMTLEEGCAMWMEDARGEAILVYGERGTQDMLVTRQTSAVSGASYVLALPRSVALAETYTFLYLVLAGLAVSVAAGFALAFRFARRQGRPLDNINANLRTLLADETPRAPRSGSIRELDEGVNALIVRHSRMTEYLGHQTGVAERLFYEKLCEGLFEDEAQILEMMQQLRILPVEGEKTLLLMALEPSERETRLADAGLFTSCVEKAIAECLRGAYHRFERSMSECVLILGGGDALPDTLAALAASLDRALGRESELSARCVAGRPVPGYGEIGGEYAMCVDVLKHAETVAPLTFARDVRYDRHFYYPVEEESRLIGFALAGNAEKAREVLSSLFEVNFPRGECQAPTVRLLATSLMCTILRVKNSLGERDAEAADRLEACARELEGCASSQAAMEAAEACLSAVAEAASQRKQGKTQERMEAVSAYIGAHFDDKTLSLASLAERFGLTEAYLSHAYKECMGENLSFAVEKLRVERAKALLAQDMGVEEIADRVGYAHAYSFRNAFKRVTGMTPSAYRDQ